MTAYIMMHALRALRALSEKLYKYLLEVPRNDYFYLGKKE
jgi:hypothetical protein